jgi:hypothetical protein
LVDTLNITNCSFTNEDTTSGDGNASIAVKIANHITITNNTIQSSVSNHQRETDGIYIDDSQNIKITGNTITLNNHNDQEHIDGVQITYSGHSLRSSNVDVENNVIYNKGKDETSPFDNRQGIYVLYTDGYIKVINNVVESSNGDGLIHIYYESQTTSVKVYNNTLVAKGNQRSIMGFDRLSSDPGQDSVLHIKNNILYKVVQSTPNTDAIKFTNLQTNPLTTSINNILDYNLYYFANSTSTPTNYFTSSSYAWNYDTTKWEMHGKKGDPLFQDTSSDNYNIWYASNAKNAGLGLLSDNVIIDYANNPRPYWNKDYDIGAYEIQGDAQLKINIANGYFNKSFTISTVGSYWEYDSNNGTFPISSNSSYRTSTYTVDSSYLSLNKWRGWDLGWLSIPSDSNKQFAHGVYKLRYNNGTDSSNYVYLDYRDAISGYSPNLYVLFDPSSGQFKYYDGSTYQRIYNGDVLRIWNVNNGGTSNTGGLTSYWSNALECADSSNHPKIIWGPKNSFSGSYNIYKNGDYYGDWHIIKSTTSTFYTDLTESYIFRQGSHNVSYKILADTNNFTNTVITLVNGPAPGKIKPNVNGVIPIVYSLNQNYPNPFNPSTIIRYSIPKDGLVMLKVYDILGRELETLVNETKQSGEYEVNFSGHNLASGVYIYRLTSGTFTQTKKMQFIK